MKLKINLLILLAIFLTSCKVVSYKFVDGEAKYTENKRILITQFDNNSGKGPPNIATTFTEKTKDYFLQNGDFSVVGLNEDLKLECEITSYKVDYSGANSGESAQRYKLTIGVKVTFYDYQALKDEDKKFTKNVSNFDFFNPSQTLSDVEDELIEAISEKLILDIYTQTVTTTEW